MEITLLCEYQINYIIVQKCVNVVHLVCISAPFDSAGRESCARL